MDFVINEAFGHAFVFYLTARQHWSRFDRNLEIYPLQAPRRALIWSSTLLICAAFLCPPARRQAHPVVSRRPYHRSQASQTVPSQSAATSLAETHREVS